MSLTKKAEKVANYLMFVPFGRAYLLTGSVANETANSTSDIDINIIARDNFVWLHFALAFIFLSLLGVRRTKNKRTGRVCVNSLVGESEYVETKKIFEGKFLYGGKSRLFLLEQALVYSGVAHFLELIAKKSISAYINNSFKKYRENPDTVLVLTPNKIKYFPPRAVRSRG